MNSENVVRLMDIFVIGPTNILFAMTVLHNPILFVPVFLTGVLTIWYNYVNFNRFYKHKDPKTFALLPQWIQTLFWDPVNGKTQLLRIVNLLIMYPLLTFALTQSQSQSQPFGNTNLFVYITWLMALFVGTGFFYNLYYFITISMHSDTSEPDQTFVCQYSLDNV